MIATILAVSCGLLASGPTLWVASLPALLVPPALGHLFAYEIALVLFCILVVLNGLRRPAAAMARLDQVEIAAGLFFLWAVFTGFWCQDTWWYLFNVRKLGVGLIALWTARRMGAWIGADDMMLGTSVGALALASAVLMKVASVGLPPPGHRMSRVTTTDIGWGTSNFVSALLILSAPLVVRVALRDPRASARVVGWITLPLIALVVTVSGSRGGALLILLLSLLLVLGTRVRRRQLWLVVPVMLALLVIGPGASILVMRFTNPAEFSSVFVRLHYIQVGWKRLTDHLPWGMGLGQGYGYEDELYGGDPHNQLIGVGSELGIPGLLLWGALVVVLWKRITPLVRNGETAFDGTMLRLALIISQLNSMFEPTFLGLQYQFLFFWIMGGGLGSLGSTSAQLVPYSTPVRGPAPSR
jgi:hypothetical protein